MTGRRKRAKKKKIDENELRRELRKQRKRMLEDEELIKPPVELPEYPEEIRIGGVEG